MSKVALAIGVFFGGAMAGLALWWLTWHPMVAIGVVPQAWHREAGRLVIDDLWSAIGKALGAFALPVVFGTLSTKAFVNR